MYRMGRQGKVNGQDPSIQNDGTGPSRREEEPDNDTDIEKAPTGALDRNGKKGRGVVNKRDTTETALKTVNTTNETLSLVATEGNETDIDDPREPLIWEKTEMDEEAVAEPEREAGLAKPAKPATGFQRSPEVDTGASKPAKSVQKSRKADRTPITQMDKSNDNKNKKVAKNQSSTGEIAGKSLEAFKQTVEEIVNSPLVEVLEFSLILLSSFLVALATLPSIESRPEIFLPINDLQDFLADAFALEFLGRWFATTETSGRYLSQPLVLVDVVVVMIPFFLTLVPESSFHLIPSIPGEGTFDSSLLINLRLLRVLKFQRVLQDEISFSKFVYGVSAQFRRAGEANAVIVQPWQLQLARVVLSLFTVLSVAAGLIYTTEHRSNPNIADYFSALYFSLTTLTTVGFGDVTPITWQGKLVVCCSILAGIAIIPAQAGALVEALLARDEDKRQSDNNPREETSKATPVGAALRGDDQTDLLAVIQRSQVCPNCNAGLHWSHATFCYNCAHNLHPEITNTTTSSDTSIMRARPQQANTPNKES